MATTDLSSIRASDIILSAQQTIAAHPQSEQTNVNNVSQPGLPTDVQGVLAQTTTLPKQTTINYVSDLNVIAYMRKMKIDFFVYNMRPNRRVFPFFSDVNIAKIVQKPNVVVVDNNRQFYSLLPRTATELAAIAPNIITENQDGTIDPAVESLGWTNEHLGTIAGPIETQSERIFIGGGLAKVYYTERGPDGRTILYISEIQAMDQFKTTMTGNTIVGFRSSSIANVVSYQHHSGIVRRTDTPITDSETVGGDNIYNKLAILRLSQDASNEDGYYVGNTFTIMNGLIPGETTKITAYEGSTRKVTVDPPLEGVATLTGRTDVIYSIGDYRDPYITGATVSHYTTNKGFFGGTIHLPGPSMQSPYMFKTGEKLFKISDSVQNNSGDATTIAEYVFNSYGIDISKGQIIVNNPSGPTVCPTSPTTMATPTGDAAPLLPAVNNGVLTNSEASLAPAQGYAKFSPVAQSFFISDVDYPKGMFVPYVDLFFATKGTLPVEVQIRTIVNGYPNGKSIVPGAVAVVEPEEIKVSGNPDPKNPLTFTRFTFNSPVYLMPGTEYAIVVNSNDYDCEIYATELGEKIIGSDRLVSQQPFLGSLFRSQNGSTYSALQTEDLMFVIHKCEFVDNGQLEFFEEKFPEETYQYWQAHTYINANTPYDTFTVHSDSIEIPGTKLNYSYRSIDGNTLEVDPTYTEFKPDKMTPMTSRKVLYGKQFPTPSFKMKVNMTTTSKDVSPILYVNRQNLGRTATIINNLWINPNDIRIANTGNGYTTQNTSVIITANTGTGANGYPLFLIDNSADLTANGLQGVTSKVGGFYLDGRGTGYAENVSITLVSSDANVTNCIVSIPSETDPSGGPAGARYISKTVKLAPEFSAGDLRVFLTAVKPFGSNLYVYYKVRNIYDNQTIDEKRWVLMTEKTGPAGEVTFTTTNALEFEYRPSFSSNTIVYSTDTATFDTFNEYKIKIVLASSGTTLDRIPYVFDMRAIALPGAE